VGPNTRSASIPFITLRTKSPLRLIIGPDDGNITDTRQFGFQDRFHDLTDLISLFVILKDLLGKSLNLDKFLHQELLTQK
jgi:hypothetical protein